MTALPVDEQERSDALSQADYEALANLRFALRRFLAFSTAAAQEAGLPAQQHQALLAIKGHPAGQAMTVGVLAERLLIAPHTATELVDRLVAGDLVERSPDPADRRRLRLTLTTQAETVLRSLSVAHLREIAEIAPVLAGVLKIVPPRDA